MHGIVDRQKPKKSGSDGMTIFQKIIDRQIPANIVYEDDVCLAFRDVNAQAPVHILLIPKKEIPSLNDLGAEDHDIIGHMMLRVKEIAASEGLRDRGYRLVVNTGPEAGQTVYHLHLHIIGGRDMRWPPG